MPLVALIDYCHPQRDRFGRRRNLPLTLTLLKLVTLAGGFTKYAAPSRATLIRKNGDKKTLMKVDLKDVMNDPKANEDLALKPGDVLIVPERLF